MTINGFITKGKASFRAFAAKLEKPGINKFIPAALLGKRTADEYEEDDESVVIGSPNSSTPLLATEKVGVEISDTGSVSDSGSDIMNAKKVDDGFDSDEGAVGKLDGQETRQRAVPGISSYLYYGGDPDKPHNNRYYCMIETDVRQMPLQLI